MQQSAQSGSTTPKASSIAERREKDERRDGHQYPVPGFARSGSLRARAARRRVLAAGALARLDRAPALERELEIRLRLVVVGSSAIATASVRDRALEDHVAILRLGTRRARLSTPSRPTARERRARRRFPRDRLESRPGDVPAQRELGIGDGGSSRRDSRSERTAWRKSTSSETPSRSPARKGTKVGGCQRSALRADAIADVVRRDGALPPRHVDRKEEEHERRDEAGEGAGDECRP